MRSMSYAFTAFLLVTSIAAPAATARPAQDPPALVTRTHSGPTSDSPRPADLPPSTPAEPQPAPADGFPWATVGLILVGAGIGLAGAVAVVRMRRRPHLTA